MRPLARRRVRVVAAVAVLALALPVAPATARARPAADAWIVVDNATGIVLSARNPDLPLFPASLTKMLTAQVVLDNARLHDTVVIGANAANAPADHMRWPLGARFTIEELLHGLLMMSSNGAAIALAEHVASTQHSFASLMRFKARGLGVTESSWTTPEGLDAHGQLATARDLATIARNLLTYPVLAKIVRTKTYELRWPGGSIRLRARNHFLFSYGGAIGIKPGYTTRARNCLAAAATRNGRTVIAVVMRTPVPTTDAATLLDEAFAQGAPVTPKRKFKLRFAALAKPAPDAAGNEPPATFALGQPEPARGLELGLALYAGAGLAASTLLALVARRRASRPRGGTRGDELIE